MKLATLLLALLTVETCSDPFHPAEWGVEAFGEVRGTVYVRDNRHPPTSESVRVPFTWTPPASPVELDLRMGPRLPGWPAPSTGRVR